MSDPTPTDESQAGSAWRKPQEASGWHKPERPANWQPPKKKEAEEQEAPPRVVSETQVGGTSGWRQPNPEDVTYRAEATPKAPETTEVIPAVTLQPAPPPTFDDDEDSDEDTFSMGELVALASLVDDAPTTGALPGVAAPTPLAPSVEPAAEAEEISQEDLSPAERAALMMAQAKVEAADPAAPDPAEYARQQLAQLEGAGPPPATPAPATTDPDAAPDPAEYARQQLAQLNAEGAPAVADEPAAPEATLDPAEAALAEKFRETQKQIRILREQFRSGLITRDQLQGQLRELMIRDADDVWWMMGVETDTWYRFENNQWIPATPPGIGAAGEQFGPAAAGPSLPVLPTSSMDDSDSLADTSMGDETGGLQVDENFMPLPRSNIPLNDPQMTVPNTVGVNLEDVPSPSAPTVAGPAFSAPTITAQPVDYEAGEYIAAPGSHQDAMAALGYDPAAPPDYDLGADAPMYEDIQAEQRRTLKRRLLLVAVIGLGATFILGIVVIGGIFLWYNNIAGQWRDQIEALASYQPQFQTINILDAQGQSIANITSEQGGARTSIALEDISPEVIHAVISTENERFFEDPGWDPIAVVRAFLQNIGAGQVVSGGSTITQQLARQLILGDTTVSAERKINEIIIATEIGRRYDKDFILELYLNEIYFGNQSYGIEAASEFYFGVNASDLNLPQAAMLAGIIQQPGVYDPVRRADQDDLSYQEQRNATFERMNVVLNRMVEVNCLQFQHAPYLGEPVCINQNLVDNAVVSRAQIEAREYRPREVNVRFPHFVDFVRLQLEGTFGETEMFRRGFSVQTTINPTIQQAAQDSLARQVAQLATFGVQTGGVMVTDPRTGAIRAMVGSPDFNNTAINGQFNNTLGWNQPGSAIKPIVYTAALQGVDRDADGQLEYMTPATIIWDVPSTFSDGTAQGYRPVNFDREFHGPVSVRSALQNSFNVPAVKTYDFIGNEGFIDIAERMGLGFLEGAQFGLPSGVGATDVRLFDMMEAYGTLANDGQQVPLYAIERIVDVNGNEVPLPEELRPPGSQTIQPQVAFLMQDILSDDLSRAPEFGAGSTLTIPGFEGLVAAKTGTSNDSRDLWTMGFTSNAVTGVWLGRVDNQPTGVSGGFVAASPVWNETMRTAMSVLQRPERFEVTAEQPGFGVRSFPVCGTTGTSPDENCVNVVSELFIETQPPPPPEQSFAQTIAVDTWTGKLSNQFCPDNVESRTFANIDDPFAVQWLNSPQGQATAQQLGLPTPLEAPPSAACGVGEQLPVVRIIQPGEAQVLQGVVAITGAVSNAPGFSRYQLEAASVLAPNDFGIVFNSQGQPQGPITQQQPPGSVLANWDTTTVPNGDYLLRLAVFEGAGGFIFRTARVTVNNPVPTPVPVVPTAVPPVTGPGEIGPTPIPFENVNPTPTIDVGV